LIRIILRSLVNIVAGKDLISVGTQFKGTDSLRVQVQTWKDPQRNS
jgi:hypothetical protein